MKTTFLTEILTSDFAFIKTNKMNNHLSGQVQKRFFTNFSRIKKNIHLLTLKLKTSVNNLKTIFILLYYLIETTREFYHLSR
jgi:hypothetical protein